MARNRQKAKARKARQQAAGVQSGAASGAGNGSAGAPPTDEGTVKAAAAVDAAEVRRAAKRDEQKAAKAAPAQQKQRGRFRSFLRSSWAELRRVQWPDRAQITTLTSIVIGFVIIAGFYLGVIDWVANKVVDQIIF